jgi:hypothetical protein
MAMTLIRRPVTAETPVRLQASPYGIYGGQIDAMTGFCLST